MARVFVAMSGGVDSSVSAALLVEEGHDVTGATMQLWPSSDEEGGCCSANAVRDARRVCDLLDIPHYTLNFRESFEAEVVRPFADEYAAGRTPNPCVVCNDRLKFSELLTRVSEQGADFLATGHYARILRDEDGVPWLAKGLDAEKDQSYFLYRLSRVQMEHVIFPLGQLCKPDVRQIAAELGLPVAEKPESQEICFAPSGGHAAVISARRPDSMAAGDIVDERGNVLGRHDGIARFTVGQRKGLGIGGGEPLFVLRVDALNRRVVVGPRESLRATRLTASDIVWHGRDREDVEAMVRYRMTPRAAVAARVGDGLEVDLAEPLEGVAPGQAVVCYRQDVVLGGGVIECAS